MTKELAIHSRTIHTLRSVYSPRFVLLFIGIFFR